MADAFDVCVHRPTSSSAMAEPVTCVKNSCGAGVVFQELSSQTLHTNCIPAVEYRGRRN